MTLRLGFLGVAILATFHAGGLRADVRPHPLFTDGAVLQRGISLPVYGTAAPGEDVSVTIHGATETTKAGPDGQWRVQLLHLKEANDKPAELTIAGKNKVVIKNVLVGDVWVCSGQSNMEWSNFASAEPEKTIAAANHPGIRLFTVPKTPAAYPTKDVNSKWLPCTPQNAGPFSAVGYHFGLNLHKELKVPIGLINTSWGGTIAEAWVRKPALQKPALEHLLVPYEKARGDYDKGLDGYFDNLTKYIPAAREATKAGRTLPPLPQPPAMAGPNIATVLSNGMIEPIIPYGIKGAIWYQGESNAGRAYEYRTLLPTLVDDWQARWGQGELPFMVVQLAPFMTKKATPLIPADKLVDLPPGDSNWAELREAQSMTAAKNKNVGLAVITDLVDDPYDIHPKQKAEVGRRLSLAARRIAYGQADVIDSGPVFKSANFDGNKAIVHFEALRSPLVCKGDKLTGFTVCGEDRKFVKAEAIIQGDTVVVKAEGVEKPVAVRFGWADYPVLNLFNKEGLPASPFRSDLFPGVTEPKK